ncbi:hypothetical protein JCM24511_07745 [Saitozyma sp. JCM 24511]|nr:hypothetical protein JCM24511_07745 [Saitozyma sp. JCM 24511]
MASHSIRSTTSHSHSHSHSQNDFSPTPPPPPPRNSGNPPTPSNLTKACARCRHHKLACKPGSAGAYPCTRCEDSGAECVLVEKQRPVPAPSLSQRLARQEALTGRLEAELDEMKRQMRSLIGTQQRDEHSADRASQRSRLVENPRSPSPDEMESDFGMSELEGDRLAAQELDNGELTTANSLADARLIRQHAPTPVGGAAAGQKRRRESLDGLDLEIARRTFIEHCLPAVSFFDPTEEDLHPVTLRNRSRLLYWAIIAVGSRESPGLENMFTTAEAKMLHFLRDTLGGGRPSYWDLCGAMVYNRWLAPIRPIGHIVDLAYGLNIHNTFANLSDPNNPTAKEIRDIRLWASILMTDSYYSGVTRRPLHYPGREKGLQQATWLASLPASRRNDKRLMATFEHEQIARSIDDALLTSGRLPPDWQSILQQRLQAVEDWYHRWKPVAEALSPRTEMSSFLHVVKINYNLAKFGLNCLGLRGFHGAEDITPSTLTYLTGAIKCAEAQCQLCVAEFQPPAIKYNGESTLYTFSSSAAFLLKCARILPLMFDIPATLGLVQTVVDVIDHVSCQSYSRILSGMLSRVKQEMERNGTSTTSVPTSVFSHPKRDHNGDTSTPMSGAGSVNGAGGMTNSHSTSISLVPDSSVLMTNMTTDTGPLLTGLGDTAGLDSLMSLGWSDLFPSDNSGMLDNNLFELFHDAI